MAAQSTPTPTDRRGHNQSDLLTFFFLGSIVHLHSGPFALQCPSFVRTNSQHGQAVGETWRGITFRIMGWQAEETLKTWAKRWGNLAIQEETEGGANWGQKQPGCEGNWEGGVTPTLTRNSRLQKIKLEVSQVDLIYYKTESELDR